MDKDEPDYSKYCNICEKEKPDAASCPICGIVYCKEHIDPSKHNCKVHKTTVKNSINNKRMRLYAIPGTIEYVPRQQFEL